MQKYYYFRNVENGHVTKKGLDGIIYLFEDELDFQIFIQLSNVLNQSVYIYTVDAEAVDASQLQSFKFNQANRPATGTAFVLDGAVAKKHIKYVRHQSLRGMGK